MIVAATAIALGLAVHLRGSWLRTSARDVIGDALWATMLASCISAVVPSQRPAFRYLFALIACFSVEFSQLWHTPALDFSRSTTIGRLILGSGFDPRDFAAYTLGILLFIWIDQRLMRRSGYVVL